MENTAFTGAGCRGGSEIARWWIMAGLMGIPTQNPETPSYTYWRAFPHTWHLHHPGQDLFSQLTAVLRMAPQGHLLRPGGILLGHGCRWAMPFEEHTDDGLHFPMEGWVN